MLLGIVIVFKKKIFTTKSTKATKKERNDQLFPAFSLALPFVFLVFFVVSIS
jgi:hypothetical protein